MWGRGVGGGVQEGVYELVIAVNGYLNGGANAYRKSMA